MAQVGARNLITDVDGILIGNAEDTNAWTGTTVILAPNRAVAGVDVRGGGPGTRETDALDPTCLVDAVDAVVLSGGSVYGLDAASGVTAWLSAQGRGFVVPGSPLTAPIVPAAILMDLNNGGDKAWATPPYHALAQQAAQTASTEFALGNIGAGYGARAGAYKGGLGSASMITDEGLQVGAIVASNPFGSPVIPNTNGLWAGAAEQNDEMGGQSTPMPPADQMRDWPSDTKTGAATMGQNTTIGLVATNAALTPAEAKRLAIMAQDGYARSIRPIHTPFDGDVVYALATGTTELPEPRAFSLARLGLIAADCMTRAVGRSVYEAQTLGGAPSYRSVFGV